MAALEPQRIAYAANLRRWLRGDIDKMFKDLAEKDGNLDEVAPYPDSFSLEYKYLKNRRAEFVSWTVRDDKKIEAVAWSHKISPHSPRCPQYRLPKPMAVVAVSLSRQAVRLTTDHFNGYCIKLEQKIGQAINWASVQGDLWANSWLDVILESGAPQRWHTQMILNRSKLGTIFNQWPTRREF